MAIYPKFSIGDKVVVSVFTDYDPPYDKWTSYGVIVGYYYQDCEVTFESPLNYKGWVYIVKIYKDSMFQGKCYLDTFSQLEISLQPDLVRVK